MRVAWPILTLALFGPAPLAMAEVLRCDIDAKYACSAQGCRENVIAVWNMIELPANKFSRCDRAGCDDYIISTETSGTFINIDVPGRGMLAKMSIDGSRYVEVVTLGTDVLISYGSCE